MTLSKIRVMDLSHLKEETHTREEWEELIFNLRRCVVKIPEWVYYHFLESVPPLYLDVGFFNSEPLDHTREGKPIYYYFVKENKNYYGMISTRSTYKFCLQLARESLREEAKNV